LTIKVKRLNFGTATICRFPLLCAQALPKRANISLKKARHGQRTLVRIQESEVLYQVKAVCTNRSSKQHERF